MKYGEIQYSEIRDLHRPNIVVGRSKDGDWVDRFDEPQTTVNDDEVVLEGYNAIAEYAESALERFEDSEDIQAGLTAIHILHYYSERFGDTTPAMHWELVDTLLTAKRPSAYLFVLASEAHPDIATALRGIMSLRAKHHTSILSATSDHHLMTYLEAESGDMNFERSLQQLQQLRAE